MSKPSNANVDSIGPDSEDGEVIDERLSVQERDWCKHVVEGQGLVEALGSRRCSQWATVRRYLNKQPIRERLAGELSLSGQTAKLDEILGYLATLAVLEALEKGDKTVILALLPKGKGTPKAAARVAPVARELGGDGATKGKGDKAD